MSFVVNVHKDRVLSVDQDQARVEFLKLAPEYEKVLDNKDCQQHDSEEIFALQRSQQQPAIARHSALYLPPTTGTPLTPHLSLPARRQSTS